MDMNISYQNLSLYQDTIRRIVEESLEVTILICNSDMPEFTVAKMFDIFNQIITTAFVLYTGYWPFYNNMKKKPICVCGRYGIQCRHYRNELHCIDLEALNSDMTSKLCPKACGQVCLSEYDIQLKPFVDNSLGYDLQIAMTLYYKKNERGRPRRKKEESGEEQQRIPVYILCRYSVQPEYYQQFQTVVFQPNPFYTEYYGTIFANLHKLRIEFFQNYYLPQQDKFFTVHIDQMPNFTLVLQHVNLPVLTLSKQMLVVYPQLIAFRMRSQKVTRCKSTQTMSTLVKNEDVMEKEAESYLSLLESIRPIWSSEPSTESLLINNPEQQIITASSISLANAASSLNNAINEEVEDEDRVNVQITDSIEYDNQLPRYSFQRAVTRKTVKNNQQLYRDVLLSNAFKRNNNSLSSNEFHYDQGNFPSTGQSTSQKEKRRFNKKDSCNASSISIEQEFSLAKVKQEDVDFLWFDHQFPSLVRNTDSSTQNDNEFTETLKMIDEVIEEDRERSQQTRSFFTQ